MTELDIRNQIVRLLAHELSIDDFKHWLFIVAWNVELEIIYAIKLFFAEYDHGDWTQEELYGQLKDLLEHATIGGQTGIQIETGTSSATKEYTS